jgi:catechol 2,3-dioxygenase-like lactoylglutathione lyase family enzyme
MMGKLHVGIPAKRGQAPAAKVKLREAPMTVEDPMMVGAATVFVVADVAKSTEHYRDVLGFTVTFEYGTPTFYVCLCRDDVALHLLAAGQNRRQPGNGGICIFVRDVDAVYAELAARGARIVKPPQDYDYACATSTCSIPMEISLHLEKGPQPERKSASSA